MKRTAGVTASAVVGIIGSVLSILVGILLTLAAVMVLSGNLPLPEGQPAPPFSLGGILIVESIVSIGLGAFGVVSSIALLRLKNWARVSFLVFGGLLCFFSASGSLGLAVTMFLMPPLQPQENVPSAFMFVFFPLFLVSALMLAAGVWWLVYFTRRNVKEQFLGEALAAIPRHGPLSITIIAWILVVGSLSIPFTLLSSTPGLMFGFIVRGWLERILLIVFGLGSLVAGIGMLRWRAEAHTLAVALQIAGLLNFVSSMVMTGSFEALSREIVPSTPILADWNTSFLWMLFLLGSITNGVVLWFLITHRRAFLEACKSPPQSQLG